MKCKKQLAALLLSIALLTGMAIPSFAEPEANDSSPTTSQTSDTPSQDGTQPEDGNADADANSDADTTAQPDADASDDASDTAVEEPEVDDKSPEISIDAKASILVNAETGEIIHAENEKEKQYPASTTKIMTALLVLEKCNLSDVVTMQDEDFTDVKNGASNAGLKVGERLPSKICSTACCCHPATKQPMHWPAPLAVLLTNLFR